jgi:hypothetical protein
MQPTTETWLSAQRYVLYGLMRRSLVVIETDRPRLFWYLMMLLATRLKQLDRQRFCLMIKP